MKNDNTQALATTTGNKPAQIFQFNGFNDAMDAAKLIAGSQLVPSAYRGRPADVIVAWQHGAELGLSPMQSLTGIAVINGRASIYGDTLLAVAMSHPDFEDISETCSAQGATCTVTRRGRTDVSRTFTQEAAKKSRLWGKKGPWQDYPERMLQMRARSWALRDAFADALAGFVPAEEVTDYQEPAPTRRSSRRSPAPVVDAAFDEPNADEPASKDLAQMLDAIDAAQTMDEFHSIHRVSLSDAERAKAHGAWTAKREALRAEENNEHDPVTGEVAETEDWKDVGEPPMDEAPPISESQTDLEADWRESNRNGGS